MKLKKEILIVYSISHSHRSQDQSTGVYPWELEAIIGITPLTLHLQMAVQSIIENSEVAQAWQSGWGG